MRRSPTRPSGQTVQGVGMTSARTRRRLIDRLRERGIHNERVLEAMLNTPRHLFVTEAMAHKAYEDTALPIGHDQTISQPYVVAMMTELLLSGREIPGKVLEVGTGSGYQTAILAQLVKRVYSIERIRDLQLSARRQLKELDLINIEYMNGDGFLGWTTFQPYDGIIVTTAPRGFPRPCSISSRWAAAS